MTGTILQINVSPGGIPKRPISEATVPKQASPAIPGRIRTSTAVPIKRYCSFVLKRSRISAPRAFAVYPGALGENLTIAGIDRRQMRIGQRYRAGETLLELTNCALPATR